MTETISVFWWIFLFTTWEFDRKHQSPSTHYCWINNEHFKLKTLYNTQISPVLLRRQNERNINQSCCQLLDSNLSQMDLKQSNTCSLCSPNTSDDYLCAIWHCPPVQRFWKELTNKQANIMTDCFQSLLPLCYTGKLTATHLNYIVTDLSTRSASSCPGCKSRRKYIRVQSTSFIIIHLSG